MADSKTQLSLELEASDLVKNIDKSAAKLEEFGDRGEKAINSLNTATDKMSTAQKRAFEGLNSTLKKHQEEIRKVADEYEKLRAKQKNGSLTKEEAVRLKELNKAYKEHTGAVATTAKELENLARKFKQVKSAEAQVRSITPQLTHTFTNLALAVQGCKIAFDAAVEAIKAFGIEQDQQISQLAAMRNNTMDATEAYRLFNDAWRNTNYDMATVTAMGKALLNLGYNAKEASALIGTVSDAAAGLGLDESGAQNIMSMLTKMRELGVVTAKDLKALQTMGMDAYEALAKSYGVSVDQIKDAAAKGQIGGEDAFKSLVDYMNRDFKGAMEKSKDNIADIWGDIVGNIQTVAGEIGSALINGSGLKDFAKDVSEISGKFVDVAREINANGGQVHRAMEKAFGPDVADWAEYLFDVVLAGSGIAATMKVSKSIKGLSLGLSEASAAATVMSTAMNFANAQSELVRTASEVSRLKGVMDEANAAFTAAQAGFTNPNNTFTQIRKQTEEIAAAQAKATAASAEYTAAVEANKKAQEAFASAQAAATGASTANTTAQTANTAAKTAGTTATAAATAATNASTAAVNASSAANTANATTWQLIKANALSSFAAIKAACLSTMKACAAAITSFLLTPLGAAIAAAMALAAALYGVMKARRAASEGRYGDLYDQASQGEDYSGYDGDGNPVGDDLGVAQLRGKQKALEDLKQEMQEVADFEEKANAVREKERLMNPYAFDKFKFKPVVGATGGKGESEAAKQFKQDKQFRDQMRQLERENERYQNELAAKTRAARLKNEEELSQNLLNLYKATGAKEAQYLQERIHRQKQAMAEISKTNDAYAKQMLEATRNLEQKQQEILDARKSKELGIITQEQLDNQEKLLNKQISMIEKSIADLKAAHKEDTIIIQVKANMNQISTDFQKALDQAQENREYERAGNGHVRTVDKIRMNANKAYETAVGDQMYAFNATSSQLAQAGASGDSEGVMTIGRALGMSDDEITAKGQSISAMYQTVSEALVNANAQEVDGFARTRDAATEHAKALESAQTAAKNYAISVGKSLGDAFADWVTGAKTAKEAMKDFASNLIKQAAQIMSEWLAVYAILLLCGSNPREASRGASKAVLNIDGKKDGGFITGPGGPRSDSIPTMLSDGEYVVNAASVAAIGKGNLDIMNQTGRIPHFADGGVVGRSDSEAGVALGESITFNVSAMDANSFQQWLANNGGIKAIKQVMKNEERNFATATGIF